MDLKGLEYSVFEWPPPMQVVGQRLLFGGRTVPAIQYGAEKLQGSTAIMHRLDEIAPEPLLFPADPELRIRVEELEHWGDGHLQQIVRDVLWAAMVNRPAAMVSYTTHSKLAMPAPAVRLIAPGIARAQQALNKTDVAKARAHLRQLPADFDRIDAAIAAGTIGDAAHPNAADLQLLSTVRLMSTLGDIRAILDGRPTDAAARALFPQFDGNIPSGAL